MGESDLAAGAMDPNQRKGLFGEELIDVLAAAAGMTTAKSSIDIHGIDRKIELPGERGVRRPAFIEAQVKAWTPTPSGYSDDHWHFRMRVKHYNKLAGEFGIPRYLFLVVVPTDPAKWIESTTKCTQIQHAVYWANLMGKPQAHDPEASTLTVNVPRKNLLTAGDLVGLFDYTACAGVVTP